MRIHSMKYACPTLLMLLLSFLFSAPLFAQVASDPNDRLYKELSLWQDRGLIRNLPPLRPYPIQLVKVLLEQVQEAGTDLDKALAAWFISNINSGLQIHGTVGALGRTDGNSLHKEIELGGDYQGNLLPNITFSGALAGVALDGSANAVLPAYGRSTLDFIYDGAVQTLGGSGLTPRVSSIGAATIGSDTAYVQGGVVRGSFGPFWNDNAVLSPLSPEAGQASLVFRLPAFTYTALFMAISATDDSGQGTPEPDKYVALHSGEFHIFDWLTIGLFETIVWGGRFEPIYLLPFPTVFYYAQGMFGFPDNSFIGLSASVKLPNAVRADFLLNVDDAGFNQLIRLDLNMMLLLAFQAGVSWTPNLPWLVRLKLTNLVVTPYTYSHRDTADPVDPNYLNYTNAAQNIGPSIQPNSDRVELSALMKPLPDLYIDLFSRFIIHGNASDGHTSGDGTIFDPGYDSSGHATFKTGTRFLSQKILEKTLQAGFDAMIYYDTPWGQVHGNLSYTFEYVMNKNLTSSDDLNSYVGFGLGFRY
jgi:hypothetical protein